MVLTKVKIVKQLYPKEINSNPFRIFRCELVQQNSDIKLNRFGNFSLKGNLAYLVPGQTYDLELEEKETDNYGTTYTTNTIPAFDEVVLTPESQRELLLVITSENIANNISNAYPNFVQLILDGKDAEIDLSKIKDVKKGRFETIKDKILSNYKIFWFQSQLSGWGVDTKETTELLEIYCSIDEIEEEFKKNPYHIYIDILDRSFLPTDKFIIKNFKDFTISEERAEYYIQYVLRANEQDGNTYLDANQMLEYLPKSLWKFTVNIVKNNPRFHYEPGMKAVEMGSTYKQELEIASRIMQLYYASETLNINTTRYKETNKYKLTDTQYAFLEVVKQYNVAALIGSAGSGKTTTISALTNMLKDYNISFILLAPTGIAARQLSKVTGCKARTIHSACMNDFEFAESVVIVDEVSMASVATMSMIAKKLRPGHKLVLIGDPSQLPSIGCGNVLKDIIESKMVPYVTLSWIFRFGIGGIATVTTDIRRGIPYLNEDNSLLFEMKEKDYRFIPMNDEPMEQILEAFDELMLKYTYKEVLILSPFNKGEYGTRAINNEIQARYNPKQEEQPVASYRFNKDIVSFNVGDKVVHTKKNDYHALTKEEYEYNLDIQYKKENDLLPDDFEAAEFPSVTVVNGEIGYVEEVRENNVVFVRYPHTTVVYTADTIRNLLLAQALSIHKSQGCEAKAVILVTHPSQAHMVNRNLLYTATSRAKEMLVQIGDVSTINSAIQIDASQKRDTRLAGLMQQEGIYDYATAETSYSFD